MAKKPKTLSQTIDKLSEAVALVNTLDYALAGLEDECNNLQAARDIHTSAFLALKRLRKIEQQMYALARAELDRLLRRYAMTDVRTFIEVAPGIKARLRTAIEALVDVLDSLEPDGDIEDNGDDELTGDEEPR